MKLINLLVEIESTCAEVGVPEEEILRLHVLAIAMRIHAQPECEREVLYGQLVDDVRDHVEFLTKLEQAAADKTGLSVETLRASILGV